MTGKDIQEDTENTDGINIEEIDQYLNTEFKNRNLNYREEDIYSI